MLEPEEVPKVERGRYKNQWVARRLIVEIDAIHALRVETCPDVRMVYLVLIQVKSPYFEVRESKTLLLFSDVHDCE